MCAGGEGVLTSTSHMCIASHLHIFRSVSLASGTSFSARTISRPYYFLLYNLDNCVDCSQSRFSGKRGVSYEQRLILCEIRASSVSREIETDEILIRYLTTFVPVDLLRKNLRSFPNTLQRGLYRSTKFLMLDCVFRDCYFDATASENNPTRLSRWSVTRSARWLASYKIP